MLLVFDVVSRYLRHRGYRLTYVRNITDIDDKIIRRAAENGEPIEALTERFIDAMHEDCARARPAAAGSRAARHAVRAADHRHDQHADGPRLRLRRRQRRRHVRGGAASPATGGSRASASPTCVPARASRWTRPSAIRSTSCCGSTPSRASRPGTRPGAPGRPGWHIECSAMSTALLGTHFDLHGGGLDLKFPHHENEIAQSCAATGDAFVNVWMHNGFVNVDEEKMSKSLGNFFTRARGAAAPASSRGAALLRALEPLPRSDQLFARAARAGGRGAHAPLYGVARPAGGAGRRRCPHRALPRQHGR